MTRRRRTGRSRRQQRPWRVILAGLALLLGASVPAWGGNGEAGQVDEFLRYGADVRSLGMGRAGVALADDASALYLNPAGLLRLKRGYSFYGMHFNPFHESRYNFVSFALSRPYREAGGWKGFFFGPASAWGFSWVQLSSDGYEHRDRWDNLIDEDFGLYQQAFMVAFARETAGAAGILGYGLNFKVVRQGISDAGGELAGSDAGFGLDFGAQLQMINPPLMKEFTRLPLVGPFFQLKHLMPLRLGFSIRNVISPQLGYGAEEDKYPTALRLGASYRLSSDWLLRRSRIFLVSDFEWLYDDMERLIRFDRRRIEVHEIAPGAGQYFGAEFQYRTDRLQLSPRVGLSHVYDDVQFSAGLGLAYSTSDIDLQFDFAHGFHEELADDQRISLTIRFGGRRDAGYYYDGQRTLTDLPPKAGLLHALTDYPDNVSLVRFARDSLAGVLDTLNEMRYLEMFVDLSLGDYWYLRARHELEKNELHLAGLNSHKAIDAYDQVRRDTAVVFTDHNLLNNAESYAMAAAASDQDEARRYWQQAGELAAAVGSDSLRAVYLQGLAARATGDPAGAAQHFERALQTEEEDVRSLRVLARFELGRCLLEAGRVDSSLAVLRTLFADPNDTGDRLESHYPRFPAYPDGRLSDDALYLVAEYYRGLGTSGAREALLSYGNLCRFYPDLDRCRHGDVERRIDELIEQLSE